MSIFKKIWAWLGKAFKTIKNDVDAVAITITEHVKQAVDSGEMDFIAKIIGNLTHSGIPLEIVGVVKLQLPRILAVELALKGLPDNPTDEEIIAFEEEVVKAIGITNQKDKLWTVVATQVMLNIKAALGDGQLTFAEGVKLVEDAYILYVQAKDQE